MQLGTFTKQPGETRLIALDYAAALHTGDSVQTAAVKSDVPSGLTISAMTVASPKVSFTISSGADQTEYKITFTITTTIETFEDELVVNVVEV